MKTKELRVQIKRLLHQLPHEVNDLRLWNGTLTDPCFKFGAFVEHLRRHVERIRKLNTENGLFVDELLECGEVPVRGKFTAIGTIPAYVEQ